MNTERPEIEIEDLNKELMDRLPLSSDPDRKGKGARKRADRQPEEKPRAPRWVRVCLVLLCLIVGLGVAGIADLAYMIHKGEKQVAKNQSREKIRIPDGAKMDGDVVIYQGERYQYNKQVITILCMGVDQPISEASKDKIGQNGQADTLVLAVLNRKTNQLKLLNISREAMTQVRVYNKGGYVGMRRMQICLSYAYGDGKKTSCLNTLQTVSGLMYGIPIHGYVTIDYDAVSVLNDAVGGVKVKVLEDLTAHDPALKKDAEVTLKGEQAQTYVRSRNTELLESNSMRMERQKQYMRAFIALALAQTKKNPITPVSLLSDVSPHLVTSITPAQATYLGSLAVRSHIIGGDILTVPGKVKKGDKYAEYIIDEKGLYDLLLNTFYDKLDEGC